MPIKEYQCAACGHRFEEILGLNDPDPGACPKCGGKELKRLMSTFRIAGASRKSSDSVDPDDDLGDDPGGDGGFGDDGGMGGEAPLGEDFGGDSDLDPSMGGGTGGIGTGSDGGGDDGGPGAGPADTGEEDAS
jgi:putative FmdB family regulatory protein